MDQQFTLRERESLEDEFDLAAGDCLPSAPMVLHTQPEFTSRMIRQEVDYARRDGRCANIPIASHFP